MASYACSVLVEVEVLLKMEVLLEVEGLLEVLLKVVELFEVWL